jgi:hypothetical protein
MKVYISGPMTGHHGLNGNAFEKAEREIIDAGQIAVNPHTISDDVNAKCSELGTVPTYEDYMHADLKALLDGCTTIYMLDGWRGSRGACMEHEVAKICGLEIIYQKGACK